MPLLWTCCRCGLEESLAFGQKLRLAPLFRSLRSEAGHRDCAARALSVIIIIIIIYGKRKGGAYRPFGLGRHDH